MAPPTASATGEAAAQAARLVDAAVQWCNAYQRPDLAARLTSALRRASGRSTTIFVAGEYKQGKSRLVNTLVGREICPVDDDYATVAFCWLTGRTPEGLMVHQGGSSEPVVLEQPLDRIAAYASERENPENRLGVHLLEIGLASPLLERGISLIDTPGVGGIRAGAAASIMAFLPRADALIFVTDALAELSGPELDFLVRARDVCPEVLVVLAKIDVAPSWRRIAELDRGHLARLGFRPEVYPVSAALRAEAVRRGDEGLNGESGFPALHAALDGLVLDPAEASSLRWALDALDECTAALGAQLEVERRALEDPTVTRPLLEQLASTQRRQGALRAAGSRWSVALSDGIADLAQRTDEDVRDTIRSVLGWIDGELERTDPTDAWEPFCASLQARVTEEAARLFEGIHAGAAELAGRIARLIDEQDETPVELPQPEAIDIDAIWAATSRSLTAGRAAPAALALSALRSGAGGIYLLGVLGGLAGLAIASPVTLGVGAAFGVKQVIDERGRDLDRRRRAAGDIARRFVADVQVELSTRSRRTIQEVHRTLRDVFSEHIGQTMASITATERSLQSTLEQEAEARGRRARHLKDELGRLEQVRRSAADLAHQIDPLAPPSARTG